jgi:hypothetical protein
MLIEKKSRIGVIIRGKLYAPSYIAPWVQVFLKPKKVVRLGGTEKVRTCRLVFTWKIHYTFHCNSRSSSKNKNLDLEENKVAAKIDKMAAWHSEWSEESWNSALASDVERFSQ